MSSAKLEESKAKSVIADLYIKVIKGLGYEPSIDNDGDVGFKTAEGLHIVAIIDSDHKQFVRIAVPGIYEAAKKSRLEILEACNYSNRLSKGAKVYLTKSARFVWVAYEVVLEDFNAKALEQTIEIGIHLMVAASRRFLKHIEDLG